MAASEPLLNKSPPQVQRKNLLKGYFDEQELKFRHVSADQFADVWLRYDRDGMHNTLLTYHKPQQGRKILQSFNVRGQLKLVNSKYNL